ncbi:TonB-dependent receptor [Chitinophaga tropicalis]|uniref:TonB-dependent siderophore receptor n=1 Tax=Chitinophaga tropicalis TaxID=2683588 RepID=A0A7K1U2J9_9BACT|nr:TonB-dependent receptor [Chitinophaga tropicalis]MVT08602.1 TonB-dependent siderophore receptor [Chitinophaga tropicalis]
MKSLLYSIILLLPLFAFAGIPDNDLGTIKGRITTSDNRNAASVTVIVKGTNKNAITAEDGTFTIHRIAAGTYQLEVSLIGYQTQSQSVTVEKGKTTTVSLQLQLSDTQLREVEITKNKNKFADKTTEQVARLPLKNLENPQVYQSVGKALMQEQLITERTDIYRNIPGAVPNFAVGGSQGMTIRGFSNATGMRNGMVTSAIVPLNPAILERVEVIKGPSGTLFGSNRNITFGGVYNYVTKKPYEQFGGNVSFAGGSFEFARFTADINTPLNQDGSLLFRLNTAAQTEGSFQDQGYAKNYTLAPSFSYQVTDRLKFLVDIDLTRGDFATGTYAVTDFTNVKARSFKDLNIGYKRSYINNGVDISNGINNIQARVEYKISNAWTSQTNYLFSEGFYKHFYWTNLTLLTDSTIARSVRNQKPETFGNIQLQQNFVGDFHIGSLRNRLVIGIDYNHNYNKLNRVTVNYDVVNINQPLKDLNADKIDALSYEKGFSATRTKSDSYSVYASDVLNITPTLMAMLSLRADRFTTSGTYTVATGKSAGDYSQNSLSPKLGLIYQVWKDKVSLFANYMNGFINLAPLVQPDNTILKLKSQQGNQWEGGVKVDILDNKLSGTISYYNIDVTNATRNEIIDGKTFTFQDGEQQSKGYELELIANPVTGLNIVAGYARNENKYTKASPALQGKLATGAPKDVANIWASYTLTRGRTKGLGFGAGGNYVGDSWFEATNTFKLPAYTLLSATVFYDQPKFRLAIKGNNLLDQKYWDTNGIPQKPLNFLGSVTFKL